jgi:peptidoglycan/xylan/chitin deacetylase (PgdA/CDA1 family)
MDREVITEAALRRVRWRERIFGLARPFLPVGGAQWASGALILLYHRIVESGPPPGDPFSVTARDFSRQMEWLARNYRVLTVAGLVEALLRGDRGRLAAVSFDDGYACTISRALPALVGNDLPATVFVDTGRLNRGGIAMSDDDVRALAAAGIEIGSHTVTHPNLLDIDDLRLENELRESRAHLVGLSGQPVAGFAHPFGRYDSRVTRATRDAGYSYACTCRQHRTNLPGDDVYQLTRVEINASDNHRRFEAKVRGRYARLYAAWYRMNPATRPWLQDS